MVHGDLGWVLNHTGIADLLSAATALMILGQECCGQLYVFLTFLEKQVLVTEVLLVFTTT